MLAAARIVLFRLVGVSDTYFSVSSEVNLQRFAIILESERGHGE